VTPEGAGQGTALPAPDVWVKTADQILASIARYCQQVSAAAATE